MDNVDVADANYDYEFTRVQGMREDDKMKKLLVSSLCLLVYEV